MLHIIFYAKKLNINVSPKPLLNMTWALIEKTLYRIILVFDAHKLDISDEFKHAIEAIRAQDDKIRIILNKVFINACL